MSLHKRLTGIQALFYTQPEGEFSAKIDGHKKQTYT